MSEVKIRRSQRFFNSFILTFYDLMLYRCIAQYFWGCKPARLVKFYSDNLSGKHLDVGVGSGYLLRHGIKNPKDIDLSLMDLNENCLNKTEQAIYPIQAKTYQRNILVDIEGIPESYQSISVNYVMHCVPGSFKEKGIAFKHLKKLLRDDGILFGSSVVSKGVKKPCHSAVLMWVFNTIGLFDNSNDSLEDLTSVLKQYFKHVEIVESGPTVLFRVSDHELR
jgi:SAM-dependent methyltransferase